MKKLLCIVIVVTMCVTMVACSKNDEAVAKDMDSKIKKIGWDIEHDPDAGTAIDDLNLIVDNDAGITFSLNLSKEDKTVTYISYDVHKSNYNYKRLSYHIEQEEDDQYIAFGSVTCVYNPAKKEVNEVINTDSNCKASAPDDVKALQKARDKALKDADITLDDLHTWSVWHHKNND